MTATSYLGGQGLPVMVAEEEQSLLKPETPFVKFEIFLLTAKDLGNIDSCWTGRRLGILKFRVCEFCTHWHLSFVLCSTSNFTIYNFRCFFAKFYETTTETS